jgi:Fe-S-cluster containining protein
MPEPRRSEVMARFADRVKRMNDAGLVAAFMTRNPADGPTEARALAVGHFHLGLVCPFLEDDACSVYADRPFGCQHYLVTSPVELCSDTLNNPVRRVKMPLAAAGATLKVTEEQLGWPQHTVPLVLALEYAVRHRAELERTYDAAPLARQWVQAVVEGND